MAEQKGPNLANTAPDPTMLDVITPIMEGCTACCTLKDKDGTRLIPIVIMTAPHAFENQIKSIQGVADVLLKAEIWELGSDQTIEDHDCR